MLLYNAINRWAFLNIPNTYDTSGNECHKFWAVLRLWSPIAIPTISPVSRSFTNQIHCLVAKMTKVNHIQLSNNLYFFRNNYLLWNIVIFIIDFVTNVLIHQLHLIFQLVKFVPIVICQLNPLFHQTLWI